jgi:ATP-binding cassette subfamily B protein
VTLFSLFWKNRRIVLLGLLCLVLSDACQLVVPLIVKNVVDGLQHGRETAAGLNHAMGGVALLVVVILVARNLWRHYLFGAARQVETSLRNDLLRKVLNMPTGYFQQIRTGDVMALATNDLLAVRMALAMGLVAGFDATVFAMVAVGAMLALDPVLLAWSILPFPVLFAIMAVALRLIFHRFDRVQAAFEDLTEKARESLAGMRLLRAYDQADGDQADFERYNQQCYDRQMAHQRVDAPYQPSIVVLAGLSVALLLGVGGQRVLNGQTTLGNFTAFVSYLGMMAWPMIAAGWLLTLFQRGAASLARIRALLERDEEAHTDADAPPARGDLEVRDLTFGYPGQDRTALKKLSFKVPAGGSLGLVGEIGSGKSTLALLLSRIYEPPAGSIRLDGKPIEEQPLRWLRRQIAWVPQEAFLFSDTIEENLRLGQGSAGMDRIVAMSRLAAVDEEVREFPQDYQTPLGERGISLSGGQKQRLCLARALLKEAPVLVLDDTLSAVDAETEHAILEQLRGAMQGRTTLVISHRISSLRSLDWILVLRAGEVIEQGTHEGLLAQGGYYRDLYELQELEA